MPAIVISVCLAVLDLVFAALGWGGIRFASKPLVALVLAVAMFRAGHGRISLGLVAAAIGDEMLLIPAQACFIMGMIAFIIMHGLFIESFLRMAKPTNVVLSWGITAFYALAAIVSLVLLKPFIGTMFYPFVLYTMFLVVMARSALDVAPLTALGGFVFLNSDTLLAFAKFWPKFPLAPPAATWLVDASYFTAQILIVTGVLLLSGKSTGDVLRSAG